MNYTGKITIILKFRYNNSSICHNIRHYTCLHIFKPPKPLGGIKLQMRRLINLGEYNKCVYCSNSSISINNKIYVNIGPVQMKKLWKPFWFTVGLSTVSFMLAAIYQYESARHNAISALKDPLKWFQYKFQRHSNIISINTWRKDLNIWWSNLRDGEKIFAPILAINLIVFGAWKIPRLLPFMVKNFCSNPASTSPCWPMLLSTFSHFSVIHILANMYVLHSFCSVAVTSMSKEEFLAMYISSGLTANLLSYFVKAYSGKSGLTLGASGAIMGVIGYVCSEYPDIQLSIIFLPWIQFSAMTAIKVMMLSDITGILMGWRIFDHAAHVGGGLLGIFWSQFGHTFFWENREPLIHFWNFILCRNSNSKT